MHSPECAAGHFPRPQVGRCLLREACVGRLRSQRREEQSGNQHSLSHGKSLGPVRSPDPARRCIPRVCIASRTSATSTTASVPGSDPSPPSSRSGTEPPLSLSPSCRGCRSCGVTANAARQPGLSCGSADCTVHSRSVGASLRPPTTITSLSREVIKISPFRTNPASPVRSHPPRCVCRESPFETSPSTACPG
jgi:hypothetical protein